MGGAPISKAPNPMNLSAIIPQQPLAYQSFTKKSCWDFFDLGMNLAQAYENLTSKGFLKPLDSTPMPNTVPPCRHLILYLLIYLVPSPNMSFKYVNQGYLKSWQ